MTLMSEYRDSHYCVKMNIIKELFLFLFLQNLKNEEFFSSGH